MPNPKRKAKRKAKRAALQARDSAYGGRTIPYNTAVDELGDVLKSGTDYSMYTDDAGQLIYSRPTKNIINTAAKMFGLPQPLQQRSKVVDSLQNANIRVPMGMNAPMKKGGSVMSAKKLRKLNGRSRRSL